jgi:hypothetical protein
MLVAADAIAEASSAIGVAEVGANGTLRQLEKLSDVVRRKSSFRVAKHFVTKPARAVDRISPRWGDAYRRLFFFARELRAIDDEQIRHQRAFDAKFGAVCRSR